MTSVQGQERLAYRNQALKDPISPAFNRFDDEYHKNPLESYKLGPSKALCGLFKAPIGPFKAPTRPSQAPLAQDLGANCYSQ